MNASNLLEVMAAEALFQKANAAAKTTPASRSSYRCIYSPRRYMYSMAP